MWRLWRVGGFEEQVLEMDKLSIFFGPRRVLEEGPHPLWATKTTRTF